MSRLKQVLINNIGYKAIALLGAIIVWLLVVNIDDPKQSRNFTTNVEVAHPEVLTQQGKYYTIPDGGNTVTFRVTARRTVMEQLTTADFQAVADMTYLENDARVPIEIKVLKHNGQVTISTRRHYLDVNIGNEMSTSFVIDGRTKGEPADGCVVDKVEVVPEVLEVIGPGEVVSLIDHVEAVCDVSGINNNLSENVVPLLIDKSGNNVDTTRLRLSSSTLRVNVTITNTKSVPIEVETSGQLPSEIELDGITTSPSNIVLKGDRSILNDITEIVIPSSVIVLDSVTDSMSTTVDITSYLPEGISLLDSAQSQVVIKVNIKKESSKTFDVPKENIVIKNLSQGLSAQIESDTISVTVEALPSTLSSLTSETIMGSIDATGLGVGNHTVKVDIDTGGDFEAHAGNAKLVIVSH